MIVLVANIGSTSFKFRLFDMNGERELARGGVDRIGRDDAAVKVGAASWTGPIADHGQAIDKCLALLPDPNVKIDAIGFKAVHGGPISGAVRVTDEVIATMTEFFDVAPAHNPPYVAAMKAFAGRLPEVPQVAAFETAFHQSIPASRTTYAVPWEWTQAGARRYGFHGASHRYIAVRTAELMGRQDLRVISCHLGGSSSVCAIENGRSVACSFGTTPQSGLPHNNRVGDFDPYCLLKVLPRFGLTLEDALAAMAKGGGLLGISGVSNDMREVEAAAAQGNERAKLAVDAFVEAVRHYVGAYLAVLNGADLLVFTGGIGENGTAIRQAICGRMDYAGIRLDPKRNEVRGQEALISADDSRVKIMVVPTNEELIVARQTCEVLRK
ncbi:MAG TPA: acetate/propionate family kinase [Phycisphaerae bacterium]|jgi:acetate kinase|nr:acetate/propionate family kinase [Phycisphaerae bacterium]HOB73917.1 acetate/propionate family kinase [Phycisphaerae bacterium]HOJ56285.1 acetate/propionate family kinase [Phycisphaerae bacterium]HOL28123.1 acetate/propionate family kinase [Phycisphaerae bacterium]HPP19766.1 acetate/propionate family kinase [Phycisphaerae bacterium]